MQDKHDETDAVLAHWAGVKAKVAKAIADGTAGPELTLQPMAKSNMSRGNTRADPALAAAQAEVAALQIENARLRQAIADEANRINIEGSAYHRAQLALDEIVTGLKERSRAALVQP